MPDYESRPAYVPPPIVNEGKREIKAARKVMARYITGIPRRGFLTGGSDSSPVLRGVFDLVGAAYMMWDAFHDLDNMTDAQGYALEVLEQVLKADHDGLTYTPIPGDQTDDR